MGSTMVPMSMGAAAPQLGPQFAQPGDLARQVAPARALREPAVPERRGAADGRRRGSADPDRRAGLAHRTRCDPHVARGEARPGQLGELVGEGAGQRGHGLVGVAAPLGEVARQQLVLLGHVAGADADDEAPTRQPVDRRQFLGRPQWVALGQNQHVREQVGLGRHRGQPPQRGGRVVPDGAHGVGQTARDGGVVAHAEIEEPRLVGHPGDPGQLGRAGRPSPSRPRRASTGTEWAAACRRRPPPRGRCARRRRERGQGRS